MKKIYPLLLGLAFSLPAWAAVNLDPLLNKVNFQLKAEQWVTTKTALVDVGINAAVADQGIDKVETNVMQKLGQISKAEWHIVSFNRQQDSSGLESIQIVAQARLPQPELNGMRDRAKSISKPGETFTIDNVQFVPSEDEIRQADTTLRNNIYLQAKSEIDSLNKTYPDQKYYLHHINFLAQSPMQPVPMMANTMMKVSSVQQPLQVGNKITLVAMVELAAMPDQIQKLVQ